MVTFRPFQSLSFVVLAFEWLLWPIPHVNSIDDVRLLPLLEKEVGLRKVIRFVEIANAHRFNDNECLRKMNWTTSSTRPLCLTEEMLHTTTRLMNFKEYTEKAVTLLGRLHGTPQAKVLGTSYPYISGGIFRAMGETIQETFTHHHWPRSAKATHFKHYYAWADLDFPNRSMVYWNLNQFKKDIEYLKEWLLGGRIKSHFFIITHNQDRPGYPDWLLDHPQVLLVFGHHVPANLYHPKIRVIPLGVDNPAKSPYLLHKVRMEAKSDKYDHTPQNLLLARFRMDLGHLRPIISKAIQANFQDLPHQKLSKVQYYKELTRTKFIISPPGIGWESSKATESHYMGRVPLIMDLFRNDSLVGLPFLTIKEEEWPSVTPAWLEAKWDSFMADDRRIFNVDKTWGLWWLTYVLKECLMVQ
uniref:Exostosin GT47 domain-containing protein n=1 Tax=Eutreptiella gymnastica TaxID=73025 RepID=A0A7S1IVY7_9EUGL|mmetsp:Transcript_4605/g.8301  ORF Transcript_4605/g.8301 Transcript_4605/m.8301 type:complete len:414 (+) Transcript_4605:83-1324(+)